MLSRRCSKPTVIMNATNETDTALVLRRVIGASAARVYSAWTTPEIMQKWLAPEPCSVAEVENDLRLDGPFRIVLQAPDGTRHVITGRYRELQPGRRVAMTWLYNGPIDFLDGMETLLEVDLLALGETRTELVLTQRRIATAQARAAFEADWPTCFDKLERTVEHALH